MTQRRRGRRGRWNALAGTLLWSSGLAGLESALTGGNVKALSWLKLVCALLVICLGCGSGDDRAKINGGNNGTGTGGADGGSPPVPSGPYATPFPPNMPQVQRGSGA